MGSKTKVGYQESQSISCILDSEQVNRQLGYKRFVVQVGLFGGTFDPIHNGHIQALEAAYEILDLDRIILVPAGDPYLKRTNLVASSKDRYNMVLIAVKKISFVEVSDIEMIRPGPSYTIDTVRELKEVGYEVTVLLGVDSIIEMDKWDDPYSLHAECEVVGLSRPGFQHDKSPSYSARRKQFSLRTIEVNSSPISSSEVRDLILSGQDVAGLVPKSVSEYIHCKKLYH